MNPEEDNKEKLIQFHEANLPPEVFNGVAISFSNGEKLVRVGVDPNSFDVLLEFRTPCEGGTSVLKFLLSYDSAYILTCLLNTIASQIGFENNPPKDIENWRDINA